MAASLHSAHLKGTGDEDTTPTRTGTLRTCVAHIITVLIGSGVLSLPWSISQLGWIAGPTALLCFAIITYLSASLLSDCYWSNEGYRNKSYMDAVKLYLGGRRTWLCALLQILSLYGTVIAYTIQSSISMNAIQKSNCYPKEGHDVSFSCGETSYMLLFGAIQAVLSLLHDFCNLKWLSGVAALMCFTYSFIGFGLGFSQVIGITPIFLIAVGYSKLMMPHRMFPIAEKEEIKGSMTGVPAATIADKLGLLFQGLGNIALVYPSSTIVLEIQDSLRSHPPENKTMKKALLISIFVTTFFYLCCGFFGYAALGNNTPRNLLTGFGFYKPYWLIHFANACICLELFAKYQIFSQPVFALEGWFTEKFPSSGFVNKFYTFKLLLFPSFQINLFKISFRTVYVASTTALAMIFPYFDQVLGVLGVLNFWPLAIYFPVEMYFVKMKIEPWTRRWIVLRSFSFACLLVTIIVIIGSIQGLISAYFR